jgi:parallel beta-helix repeat protein
MIATKNTFLAVPYSGIYVTGSSFHSVTSITVNSCACAVALQNSGSNILQTNRFSEATSDAIYEDTSLDENSIIKNTVVEAAFGVFIDSSVGAMPWSPIRCSARW